MVETKRTDEEAWALAMENQGLVYSRLYKFVYHKAKVSWYKDDALRQELESIAWIAFFKACRKWDSKKGTLSTYAVPAIDHAMVDEVTRLNMLGGNNKNPGHGNHPKPPYVGSLEGKIEELTQMFSPTRGGDSNDALWDGGIRGDWIGDAETLEADDIVERIYDEQVLAATAEIIEKMSEPHRSIFILAHREDPRFVRTRRVDRAGLSYEKIAEAVGISRHIIMDYLEEAELYVKNQLSARGFTDE